MERIMNKNTTSNMAPTWAPAPASRIKGTGKPGTPVAVTVRIVNGKTFRVTELAPVMPKTKRTPRTPYRVVGTPGTGTATRSGDFRDTGKGKTYRASDLADAVRRAVSAK